MWVFINIVKQSLTAHPTDGRCSSRKCFTAIQIARDNARTSHAAPNIQEITVRPVSALILTLHTWVPERMYSSGFHQPDVFKFLIYNRSLPDVVFPLVLCIAVNITEVIWIGRRITMRNINIFLDCWYMTCNRVTVMTCVISQSGWCHWDTQLSSSPASMRFTITPIQSPTK